MTRKTTTVILENTGSTRGYVRTVESVLRRLPGVLRAEVNPATEAAYVEYDADRCNETDLEFAVESLGMRTRLTSAHGVQPRAYLRSPAIVTVLAARLAGRDAGTASRMWWAFAGIVAIAGFLLIIEHRVNLNSPLVSNRSPIYGLWEPILMPFHYAWLFWSSAFLIPWGIIFALNVGKRSAMWRVSLVTSLFGLTEPIFVPRYWNPPSLFELAQRSRFDIESLIFSFAIGGIGVVLYDAITRRNLVPMESLARHERRHSWHRVALLAPFVLFVPLYFLPWNPIFAALVCLVAGAVASVVCRPDLLTKTMFSGVLFLVLYGMFMFGLRWFAPGYIEAVWNLPDLSGVLIGGIPLEELLFGFAFGMYWASVYEHFTWRTGALRERLKAM